MRPDRYLLRDLAVLAAAVAVLLLASLGVYRLIAARTGRPAVDGTRAADLEARLRPFFRRALLADGHPLDRPPVQEAVDEVMGRLLPAAGRLARPAGDLPEVEVLVLDSPVVNAFALPGGLIAVHGGLLDRLEHPEELAAVLAHELAHVAYHDSLNGMARALGISLLLSMASGGSETLLKEVLEQASVLRYSRITEERADRYALDLLVEARIDPGRLADALSRLDNGTPPALLRYLDTHPDLDARIGRAKRRSVQAAVATEPLEVEWPREALRALDGAGGAVEP